MNGEYKQAFDRQKNSDISIKCYKPNITEETDGYSPFYLPHFLLSLDEWSSFLLATDATQRPFWDKVLQESYRFYKIGTSDKKQQEQFINYLKYRVCNLIFSALRQADTDTARITTAASIPGSIASIIENNPDIKKVAGELLKNMDLANFRLEWIFPQQGKCCSMQVCVSIVKSEFTFLEVEIESFLRNAIELG